MRVSRVAYLSMHTSPLLQPGVGDAGGMNVYVDELARAMTARGIQVDVFTRRHARNQAPVVHVDGSYTVHHIDAGPYGAVPVAERAPYVAEFAEGVMARFEDGVPDIVHSHYWLSGWAGIVIKRRLGIPLAHSFHTLGRVKDLAKRGDDPPEPLLRIAAELEVIRAADCLIAATPLEAEDLMLYYRADPARICTSPPGVDHGLFHPGDSERARDRLGLPKRDPIVLYAGRIQPLKGVDVALEAVALLTQEIQDLRFCVVGGPSGRSGTRELARLRRRAGELGLEETVYFHPPVPHRELADYYRAADVLVLPSRSESFGLVAAEAQASGLPVIASRVGGLIHVVDDGRSGLLIEGWEPSDYAAALRKVLTDPELAESMGRAGIEWSERFSWDATVSRFVELYQGVLHGSR